MGKTNILLIDDDTSICYLNKLIINSTNIINHLEIKNNAKSALEYLFSSKKNNEFIQPDIILLDINMPEIDGWGFLDQYETHQLNNKNRPKIYLLSASIDPFDEEKAKQHKLINGFIKKPLSKEVVLNIVEEY